MMLNNNMILLHEPCLHRYYVLDLFKTLYAMDPPERGLSGAPYLPTACLSQCVASAHALCEIFGALHLNDIRSLPTHLLNRVM